MVEFAYAMAVAAFLFLDGFGDGGELAVLLFVVVVKVFVYVVIDKAGVDFDVEFDHVGGVLGLKGHHKNRLSIGLDGLL